MRHEKGGGALFILANPLLKASKFNLRLIQRQLGHESSKTTEVYAHVFDQDMEKALGRLYM